jgi:hypothetical protein
MPHSAGPHIVVFKQILYKKCPAQKGPKFHDTVSLTEEAGTLYKKDIFFISFFHLKLKINA